MDVYVRVRGAAPDAFEWQRARVLSRRQDTGQALVQLAADGRQLEANEACDVLPANTLPTGCASLADVTDLDALTHLHEASFVDYLRHRYDVDEVYCKSGAVLIAVNPFKAIRGLYDMTAYRERITGGGSGGAAVDAAGAKERTNAQQETNDEASDRRAAASAPLPPHVFSIAESAFRSLRQAHRLPNAGAKRDQTILVSGESGAGKTETTKFVMNYLADVSSSDSSSAGGGTSGSSDAPVGMSGSQLLSANPILESFGNARTLRNDNSSRFGKFVRMFFGPSASASSLQRAADSLTMVGTSVDTYLLEKVRVVHQSPGERNYHVFYELLACPDAALKQSLQLEGLAARDFQYTRGGSCFHRNDGVQDAAQFARVRESMAVLGFTPGEQDSLWRTLSALLHLGNVSFIPSTDDEDETNASALAPCRLALASPSQLPPETHLAAVARLLGVERAQFLSALTTRKISISGECFHVNLSQAQCSDARDAMARSLYGVLFQFLVAKINANAPQPPPPLKDSGADDPSSPLSLPCIAVLDIFGFEEFDVNLFEQFCINYANEKLQFQFLQDILLTEQQAHVQEGVPWRAVDYDDNALCLDMLEQRPHGIFSLLDEECIIPKGSDQGFARKMYLQLQQHAHFSASRKEQADSAFTIHHYAGRVQYDARGFCEKNKDQPNAELASVLNASADTQLSGLFRTFVDAEQQQQQRQPPKLRRRSSVIGAVGIASQFKQQLAGLIEVVQQTQTHYIRCIKPNDRSAQSAFDLGKVASQLRYGGVLKAVEIMRQSYPVRMPHAEFVKQYRVLAAHIGAEAAVADASERVRALTQALAVQQVEVGRTRVFLRQSAFDELERRRDRLRVRSVVAIQSRWKARAQRLRYRAHVALVGSIQKRWRAVRELRRRKRRRDGAVKVLQAAARRWLAKQRVLRHAAARVLQRVVRVWEQKQAALRATLPTAISSSPSSSQSSAEKVEKRFGSVVELEAPPVDHGTERGSMASYSVETSSYYSEDPVDELELATRSSSNASLMFDEVARAPENLMLRQALEELERLRYRAEAAEAALLQMAASGHVAPGLGAIVAPPRTAIHDHAVAAAGRALPPSAQAAATATVDAFGNTALHQAVAHGDVARALALLTGDAQDADMVSAAEHQRGRTPLHVAVASGHAEMVGLFFRPDVLPRVDLDGSDRDGNTALHLAAQLAFELADRVMELLLCFGASPNAANDRKQTPLHLCAIVKRSGGSSAELMAKLLRHNADPQQRDALKRTPLHYCVESGMDEEAVLLMQHGADLNVPDADGVRVVTHPKATSLLRFIRVTPSWIPDADVLECMVCVEAFAFYSRKHHCDRCGRVCCSDCSSASSSWNGRFCFDCKHYQHAE